MDISSIDLPGCEVESIRHDGEQVILRFSRAYIIKTMTGSVERTRWYQSGDLIFEQAEVEGDLPTCPCICAGGDVGENIYTYRDMIPLPLESQGRAHCDLRFENGGRLRVQAAGVRLVMEDRPYYIEHLR